MGTLTFGPPVFSEGDKTLIKVLNVVNLVFKCKFDKFVRINENPYITCQVLLRLRKETNKGTIQVLSDHFLSRDHSLITKFLLFNYSTSVTVSGVFVDIFGIFNTIQISPQHEWVMIY